MLSDTSNFESNKLKIDPRIIQLIEYCTKQRQRSLFLIIGEKCRDVVVSLYQLLVRTSGNTQSKSPILWCYKKELGFTTHRKKRFKELQKKIKLGLIDSVEGDPWEIFISTTSIRYCYYAETHKILGNTFRMCILQDFEAITPNILARTIETVIGGGVIIFLLRHFTNLNQLYKLTMDLHSRYRTESHNIVFQRFNERFILSLTSCPTFLALNDSYHILPLSSNSLNNLHVERPKINDSDDEPLNILQTSLFESKLINDVLKCCCTLDQTKLLLLLANTLSDDSLSTTVSITAARGRGKSSCMGLAVALALFLNYSSIFLTSPNPENLNSFFEFLLKGLETLGYEEHTDYEIVRSTNPNFKFAVTRLTLTRKHRQTVQYIHPKDAYLLSNAELLIIDEAAAIPLPLLKQLFGHYLIFLASTVNGYEGTGRSLSLKLMQELRNQSTMNNFYLSNSLPQLFKRRYLHEIELETPIRYSKGDHVEIWLDNFLCLNVNTIAKHFSCCPPPDQCELFYVNRDTLFSFHKASEEFLSKLMSLYVSSHYKNSPNDLHLMSDAPAHHIFVLLGSVIEDHSTVPDIICVLQVCFEGNISKEIIRNKLSKGIRANGDLIPWIISEQFQDFDFGTLSGARIVRIATHPNFQRMGYGSRAIFLLKQYFEGFHNNSQFSDTIGYILENSVVDYNENISKFEQPTLRVNLPPLLVKLCERRPEKLNYIGVSYGLTEQLYHFWSRVYFFPVYIRQTENLLTGEHSIVMLCTLNSKKRTNLDDNFLVKYFNDFRIRFIQLLSFQFKYFPVSLALSIIQTTIKYVMKEYEHLEKNYILSKFLTIEELYFYLSKFDLNRLYLYSRQLVNYHFILDLIPIIANLIFRGRTNLNFSLLQNFVLIGIGLQHKLFDELEKESSVPSHQLLGLFNKSIKKISKYFYDLESNNIHNESFGFAKSNPDAQLNAEKPVNLVEHSLFNESQILSRDKTEKIDRLLESNLSTFEISDKDDDGTLNINVEYTKRFGKLVQNSKIKNFQTDALLLKLSKVSKNNKKKIVSRNKLNIKH